MHDAHGTPRRIDSTLVTATLPFLGRVRRSAPRLPVAHPLSGLRLPWEAAYACFPASTASELARCRVIKPVFFAVDSLVSDSCTPSLSEARRS